jgi:ketosteroid isomerase-like protein
MSQENVKVVQRIIQAFMQRDWPTALDCYDDAVELDQTRMPGGGVYHGHDGMNAFYARWIGSWNEFEAKLVELIDAGDDAIAILDMSGVGKTSGVAVTMRSADVYTVAGGRVVRHVGYPDASEALEAVGLRE